MYYNAFNGNFNLLLFVVSISDSKLEDLMKKESFSQKITKLFRGVKPMTEGEFNECASKLYKCSLKSVRDLHELHLRRLLGNIQESMGKVL